MWNLNIKPYPKFVIFLTKKKNYECKRKPYKLDKINEININKMNSI